MNRYNPKGLRRNHRGHLLDKWGREMDVDWDEFDKKRLKPGDKLQSPKVLNPMHAAAILKKTESAAQTVNKLLEASGVFDFLERRGYRRGEQTQFVWFMRNFGAGRDVTVYIEDGWVDVDVVLAKHKGRSFRTTEEHLAEVLDVLEPIAANGDYYADLRDVDVPNAKGEDRGGDRPISQWASELGWNVNTQPSDEPYPDSGQSSFAEST